MGHEDIKIGNYHILSTIAYGSFGRVYLARHSVLANRTVALKLMHTVPLSSTEEHRQFLNEAKILELLQHPFILPILDVGVHDGSPYIVSEYAEGGSLRQYLQKRQGGPCTLDEALPILSQIAQGLQYAHQQNIIHRDLKPENILFNGKGEALLADFGLATMLATASVKYVTNAGTPRYMSPEQFQGKISKETDQYALGCIAYELLSGRALFEGSDPVSLMYQHVHTVPTSLKKYNPQISSSADLVVLKALSKQRQDRYSDVTAFIAALSDSQQRGDRVTQTAPTVIPLALQKGAVASAETSVLPEIKVPPEKGGVTLPQVDIEDHIPTAIHTPVATRILRNEESQITAIAQIQSPQINTVKSGYGAVRPVQPEEREPGAGERPTFFAVKPLRRGYIVGVLALLCLFVAGSLLWVWQNAQSATKGAPLVSSDAAVATPTVLASPSGAVMLTPTVRSTGKPTATLHSATPNAVHPTTVPVVLTTPSAQATARPAPTATPLPTPTPLPTATPIPTPTPTPVPMPQLVANPADLSSVTSQCPMDATTTWTCTVTLSLAAGTQGSISWSGSNNVQACRGTCTSGSYIVMSPTSGTVSAGGMVQVSVSAQYCYPTRFYGSLIFSGPSNTVTIPFRCDSSPG